MAFHPSTPILTAIAIIVLIPMIHLFLVAQTLSTWSLTSALAKFAEPDHSTDKVLVQHAASTSIQLHQEHELIYDLGNVSYFTPTHAPAASFPFVHFANSFLSTNEPIYTPSTVLQVPTDKTVIRAEDLQNLIDTALSYDDVISSNWLETLILLPDLDMGESSTISFLDWNAVDVLHQQYGVKTMYIDPTFYLPTSAKFQDIKVKINRLLPPAMTIIKYQGPYLMKISPIQDQLHLYPVYRLYPDIYRAFLYGMYRPNLLPLSPPSGASYNALRAIDERGYNLIPVPSRLYGKTPHSNGVRGERIAVKDIYDVHGVVTSAGSRKYGELYGAANSSADAIVRLEALGGVFVGKTKTAAFAIGSRGNDDSLDEQYPFSARGDGWQTCIGSSSGSGCAMGAYDWLDFAIGSDTGGSVRGPAAVVGLYGNRPSTGAISLKGVRLLSAHADTAGVLARDPHKFCKFIKAWYGRSPLDLLPYQELPKRIQVATDYPEQQDPAAQEIVNDFLESLDKTLGFTLVHLDLEDRLAQRNFTRQWYDNLDVKYKSSVYWWSWQKNGKDFQKDYKATHDGQYAPIDPMIRYAWEQAEKNGSWAIFHEANRGVREFKDFFNSEILPSSNKTCSESILIYDIGQRKPLYRESELEQRPKLNTTMDGAIFCPWAGCVDFTIPIGQVPYQSVVSHVEEQRPVTVSLVAHPQCDFMLLDFVNKLAESGLIQTVKTGRSAF